MKKNFMFFMFFIIIFSCLLFFWLHGRPKLEVTPEKALADVPVNISVSNLKAHERITIKASCRFGDNSIWASSAVFEANDKGIVDVATQAPISGSYQGIDSMGLFWAMVPTEKITPAPMHTHEVLISVAAHDKILAQKTISRLSASPDVHQREIHEEGIVGTFFYPKNIKSGPGIITLTGSSGGISTTISQLLASHGYAVLALGYFGMSGLPDTLESIPLEYFQKAMQWLKKQPQVNPNCIALWGVSYGGELVMLLGSTFPKEMQAIIAYVPSSLVYGGVPDFNKPAWTFNNKPIPFMPMPTLEEIFNAAKEGKVPFHKGTVEDPQEPLLLYRYGLKKFSDFIEKSTIPVENIRCPILIFSGEDDKLWPSTLYADRIMKRLDEKNSNIERKHIPFPGAGHYFEIPYAPSAIHPYCHPVVKFWCALGGTLEDNAHASISAWRDALAFLETHLQCNKSKS
jgi:dienelactone hydrolase